MFTCLLSLCVCAACDSTCTGREEAESERRRVSQLNGHVNVGHGGGDGHRSVQVREAPEEEEGGQII